MFQENSGLVVPWIIGFITFMALEAVAMVYSNVLRDHVNRVCGFLELRSAANKQRFLSQAHQWGHTYRVILSVLDPRKCECLKDYSLDFEHACMTTYLAS